MPELPEVETVARQLASRITGRRVRSFRILDPLLRNGRTPPLRERTVEDVGRLGKQVLLQLSPRPGRHDPLWALIHLRMTGRLIYTDGVDGSARRHLRARMTFDRGALLFVDTRRFGTLHWLRSREEGEPEGLDPLSPAFTPRALAELLDGSGQELKPWLLRQDRLVGLGNIYASEILYAARLSPFRPAGSLTPAEVRRLHSATRRVLRRAIESCGTTFSDFQDARGIEGSYQRLLAVYDRSSRRCRRCRTPIERSVQQQRSTFYCPGCQD